ncbi:MAG: YHS domain-containing protein [Acidobacteria bacterium]|nr:YHS domain-containing protein [Acidobacteriota bacterium]
MLRFLGLLLAFIFIVPLIRMVTGLIGRAFVNFTMGPKQAQPQRRPGTPPPAPAGGTLRQDPVCGTYVSERVAVTLNKGGQTHYFCSAACRDKFA